ncbi:SDR family oxidoreductase [Aureimonas frigidaquae]|uniref:SDR family oxidoreductase n=1 Tax=Aureimonas frigidaquae TaxID=424757 RepID=UPI00078301BA|nr:SDR family oxidoreductase [Aureimonas frigidaquae]
MHVRLKPLNRQTIVITGATSGIGLATARAAAAAGARLILVARNADALRQVEDEIRAKGGNAVHVVADVADAEAFAKVSTVAQDAFGGFDTFVNNAGVGVYCELMDLPLDEHRRLFETNYWGVVHGSRLAVEHFRKRPGGGALINIGSINSELPIPLLSAYSATKHAVKGFTEALRMELWKEGAPVAVTLVKPSGIGTPFPQHARNHLDSEPTVAPPIYAPEIVARAILHAACHPVRDVTVGGAGRLMIQAYRATPSLMDRFLGLTMPVVQRTGKPSTRSDNLFEPAEDGAAHSPNGGGRPFSSYTFAQRHPVQALALVALGAAVTCALSAQAGRRR